jgi:hypothetical protein
MYPGSESAEILHHGANLQLALWRDLLIQRWTAASGLADVQTLDRVVRELVATRPGTKYYMMTLLQISAMGTMDEPTRKVAKENRDFMSRHLAATVVVLDSTGFVASIIRGLIAAQRFLQRSTYPFAITASVSAASQFFAPLMRGASHPGMTPASIENLVADLVKRLDAAGPVAGASGDRVPYARQPPRRCEIRAADESRHAAGQSPPTADEAGSGRAPGREGVTNTEGRDRSRAALRTNGVRR